MVTSGQPQRVAGKPQRNDRQTSVKIGDEVKKNDADYAKQVVTSGQPQRMAEKPQRNDKQTSVKIGDEVKKNDADYAKQVVTSGQPQRVAGKPQRNDRQTSVKIGDEVKKNDADYTKKEAYRNYRVALRNVKRALKKVNNAQRKLEKLQQDLNNERQKVAEKITSGNNLTIDEALALEKALQEVDEKYGAKIAGARTSYENAQLDLEHAEAYLEIHFWKQHDHQ